MDAVVKTILPRSQESPINESLVQAYLELAKVYSLSEKYAAAFQIYSKTLPLVADSGKVLSHIAELPSEHVRQIWTGEPYLILEDFEADETVQLFPWVKGADWDRVVSVHRSSRDIAHGGKQAEFLGLKYDLQADMVDSLHAKGRLYDYWCVNKQFHITKASVPTGIRVFVKEKKKNSQTRVRLVIGFRVEKSSRIIYFSRVTYSNTVKLSDDWTVLSMNLGSLDHYINRYFSGVPGVQYIVNRIAIGIIGPNTEQNVEIYIDDFQVFISSK